MRTPVLETERLVLDALRLDDAAAVYEYCQDEVLQRSLPVPVPYTHADALSFVTEYAQVAAESADALLWAIRVEGEFAGVIELKLAPLASATVGFWLGTAWRGQAIMTEALETIVEFGFDERGLALRRLHWESVVGNIGSAIVARRAGFHFEGTMRQSLISRDARHDSWQASLLATDSREPTDGWPL
jgi:RimJ/RimL family protein N-acetyltransferase